MENPYSYDAHLKYVTSLRSMSQWDSLRSARESMLSIFPLTEGDSEYMRREQVDTANGS
jgi:hypothetical protein